MTAVARNPETSSPTSPIPTAFCARSRCRSPTSPMSGGRPAASAAAARRMSSAGVCIRSIRAAIAVVMRDLNVALLMADIVEGVPVSYATFVGYDEVAHHSGIREPDALAVLKRHDRQLERLERAVAQAPRPYHLVVLSDHGQTQGAPFRQRYDETLEEVVRGRARAGRRARPGRGRRGLGRRRRGAGRRAPGARPRWARARACHAQQVGRGHGRAGAEPRGAGASAARPRTSRVRAGGGGDGLRAARPDLPAAQPERLTLEQIAEAHPELLDTLTAHPGIGFVMVRSQEHGHARDRRLRATGAWPTTRSRARTRSPTSTRRRPTICAATTASRTARTCSSTACMTRPRTRWPRSRSSWAPTAASADRRRKPFAVVPAEWSEPAGADRRRRGDARALRDWLAQLQRGADEAVELRPG